MPHSPHITYSPDDLVSAYEAVYSDTAMWLSSMNVTVAPGQTWYDLSPTPHQLLEQYACAMSAPQWHDATDWSQESLADLIHHINETHHAYLLRELPRVTYLMQRALIACTVAHKLISAWDSWQAAMLKHLQVEESIIFPYCLAVDHAGQGTDLPKKQDMSHRLHLMSEDHQDMSSQLRDIIVQVEIFADSSDIFSAISTTLAHIEADLDVHFYKENDILLPGILHLHDMLQTRILNSPRPGTSSRTASWP